MKFTINVTVVDRSEWKRARAARPYLAERPNANIGAGVGLEERIGLLMPDKDDRWWTVTDEFPTESVAGEVIGAVEQFVLPTMQAQISRGDTGS